MPKVSVLIPAYNAMKYLPETLESLCKQTWDDFEVIIVNDGSSDNIQKWFSDINNPKIRLISQENLGLAEARNTGIAHAKGEYLAFLDADDIWHPTKLEKQVLTLEKHPEVGLVYTWVAYINEEGKPTGRVFRHQAEGDVWKQLTARNIVECGSVAMVRRSCFETVGIFDKNLRSFVEDWDMWLRIAARYPFKVVKEPLVYYRQTSSSASKNWQAMEQSFQIVIEKAFASTPQELLYMKKRSYSFANLCLAWKALQSHEQDYKKAIHFRTSALSNYPLLCFSKEYIRLSLAINMMRLLKPEYYKKMLAMFHDFRQRLIPIRR